jgi:hypothetical protein
LNSTKNNKKEVLFFFLSCFTRILYISPPSPFSWRGVFTFFLFFFFIICFVVRSTFFSGCSACCAHYAVKCCTVFTNGRSYGLLDCYGDASITPAWQPTQTLPFLTHHFLASWSPRENKTNKFFFCKYLILRWNNIWIDRTALRGMNNETNEKGNFSQPLPPQKKHTQIWISLCFYEISN